MPGTTKSSPAKVHLLKVTLEGIQPAIWRRLEVPSDATIGELHDIVQIAFGWDDSHLHEFRGPRGVRYGPPDPDSWGDVRDEDEVTLAEALPRTKSKLVYEYDFGDSWKHVIVVEKILPPRASDPAPRCIAGQRAGPPEDCGGPWGYMDLLQAVRDPEDPENAERLDWLGDDFDPEEFDPEEITAALQAPAMNSGKR